MNRFSWEPEDLKQVDEKKKPEEKKNSRKIKVRRAAS